MTLDTGAGTLNETSVSSLVGELDGEQSKSRRYDACVLCARWAGSALTFDLHLVCVSFESPWRSCMRCYAGSSIFPAPAKLRVRRVSYAMVEFRLLTTDGRFEHPCFPRSHTRSFSLDGTLQSSLPTLGVPWLGSDTLATLYGAAPFSSLFAIKGPVRSLPSLLVFRVQHGLGS